VDLDMNFVEMIDQRIYHERLNAVDWGSALCSVSPGCVKTDCFLQMWGGRKPARSPFHEKIYDGDDNDQIPDGTHPDEHTIQDVPVAKQGRKMRDAEESERNPDIKDRITVFSIVTDDSEQEND
jgi:hypothetical protein